MAIWIFQVRSPVQQILGSRSVNLDRDGVVSAGSRTVKIDFLYQTRFGTVVFV